MSYKQWSDVVVANDVDGRDAARQPTLTAQGVVKHFGGTAALRGVDLALYPGEVHSLVGENGSGKSTLLKVLSGVYKPDAGVVAVDGVTHAFHGPRDAATAGVCLVSQEGSLVPELSVGENLLSGRLPRRAGFVQWSRVWRLAAELLDRADLNISPKTRVAALNPSQRQMVEIARVLAHQPRVVLFDEPTSSLGTREVDVLLATIQGLKTEGMAVAFVSHRLSEMFAVSDRYTVLRDGDISGRHVGGDVEEAWIVRSMVGRELKRVTVASREPAGVNLLEIRSISDASGAVRDVSLSVEPGEIVGIGGLVGAGRTELLETVFGARHRRGGEILVEGKPVSHGIRHAMASGLGLVTEDRKTQALLPALSVYDNAALLLKRRRLVPIRRRRWERATIEPWMQRMDVRCGSYSQSIAGLSGGNQQKVLIARALLGAPRVLMLDEPTRGIDLAAKQRIYEEIVALAESGMGVLMVSSEIPELLALSHRVLVMREGTIVAHLEGSPMTEEAIVAAATGAINNVHAA